MASLYCGICTKDSTSIVLAEEREIHRCAATSHLDRDSPRGTVNGVRRNFVGARAVSAGGSQLHSLWFARPRCKYRVCPG